jgi:hypothetical protein
MIRNVKGELVCECDDCGSEVYGGTLDFMPFVHDLKQQGWQIKRDDTSQWQHFCPDCKD